MVSLLGVCAFVVMAYGVLQDRQGWDEEGQPPGNLVLSRSLSFWLKMGKGDIWKSRACMKSVAWNGLF